MKQNHIRCQAASRLFMAMILAFSCVDSIHAADPVDFVRDIRPIFEQHCYDCHGVNDQESGLRLDIKAIAFKGGDNHGPDIIPGEASRSPLIRFVTTDDSNLRMPPDNKLPEHLIETLTRWINEGAVWPDGVDRVTLRDNRDHWSFKPLAEPNLNSQFGFVDPIDGFIMAKLAENGLVMSRETDRLSWLRRVSFDLIGLPPTPEQVKDFLTDDRSDAYERVVDRLLGSARYGERWAQHWLDVVRYADTHGFEVNTERPNAWPYRDYVIRAFNSDTPYDRFIREQIVGDTLGEDAATGFLVTASVLLSGQIGKDAPSIRLARQDSLDEIVNNIGQTFLGLSVGCARCHDHKFDPITSRDYYSMQAFVAGVEYADRKMTTPEAEEQSREAEQLRKRLAEIDNRLTQFSPIARPGTQRPSTSTTGDVDASLLVENQAPPAQVLPLRPTLRPSLNTDRIKPILARRLRFTILSTNGLEPCIDELEVFDPSGTNVALASHGTEVITSGDTIVADRHEPEFINDGLYGNSRSWLSNQPNSGWVELEFPSEAIIERVVWSRDREGKLVDRNTTEYRIEAFTGNDWLIVADSSDRNPVVAGKSPSPSFSTLGLSPLEATEANQVLAEKRVIEKKIKQAEAGQFVFAGKFRAPDKIRLLSRGDPEQPKDEIEPAVIEAFDDIRLNNETPEKERRRVLANWLASPKNPLTARVMVNRIWQGHFGSGLVPTPSDFGNSGMIPTHPELLDWLASEFIRCGWSIKRMHRLIVLSKVYRQSSQSSTEYRSTLIPREQHDLASERSEPDKLDPLAVDAEVRLLWRYPSRRLESEAIRDSMLSVSGLLNSTMYGRGYDLFDKRGGLSGFKPIEELSLENQRRMIYAHKVRRETEAVFGAFDCPDAGQSAPLRRLSTTPIQALNLFNSRFTLDVSAAFAERVTREAGDNLEDQVQHAYQLALNRVPTADELRDIESIVHQHGLAVLCRVLFNCNEFLFVP